MIWSSANREPLLHDRRFRDLFVREPILGLMEAILGSECRFGGQSVIRNEPGKAISQWHIDDCNKLDFPLPEGVPRHDCAFSAEPRRLMAYESIYAHRQLRWRGRSLNHFDDFGCYRCMNIPKRDELCRCTLWKMLREYSRGIFCKILSS
jgi:hypothetical protein